MVPVLNLHGPQSCNARPGLPRPVNQEIIRTARPQACVADPRWLPVVNTHAALDTLDHVRHVLNPRRLARLALRDTSRVGRESVLGVRAAGGPIGLGDDDLLPVCGRELVERVFQVRERRLRVVEGVVRDADHVEVRGDQGPLAQHRLVPPRLGPRVPPVVEVDHDLGFRAEVAVLDAPRRRVQQRRDVVPRRGPAQGPEQARADLVTDGDYARAEPGARVGVGDLLGVVVYCVGQGVDGGGVPGGGGSLWEIRLAISFFLHMSVEDFLDSSYLV